MNTLKAERRNMETKAKKLRREGFVTGNVFGKEIKGSIPVQMAQTDAERFIKGNGVGSQVMLELDGQQMDVLVKEIDYDSMKNQILEIDFQALVKGEKVHSVAEIILRNHEKVNTGVLEQILHEVSYRALPEALVEKIELDVGNMRVGDTIKVGDLDIASDEKVDLLTDREAVVVTVSPVHNEVPEDSAEGTEETAEA